MESKELLELGLNENQANTIATKYKAAIDDVKKTLDQSTLEKEDLQRQIELIKAQQKPTGTEKTTPAPEVAELKTVKQKLAETEAALLKAQNDSAITIALLKALSGEKFSSEYAKDGVMNELKNQNLTLENGALVGVEEAIKSIKDSKPDAFAMADTHTNVINIPAPGSVNHGFASSNQNVFSTMGYKQRLELKNTNPAMYQQLKGN